MNTEDIKLRIILFSIINYRLSLKSLFELFNIEKTEDITDREDISFFDKQAIKYILDYETVNSNEKDQKRAKMKTIALITKIKLAKTLDEKLKYLVNEDDSKALNLRKKEAKYLTDEEKKLVLSYRYRHALKMNDMTKIYPYHRAFFYENEKKLEDEDLKLKLQDLSDYYSMRRKNKAI